MTMKTEASQMTLGNMFGDMTNKATVKRWGKKIMVDIVQENSKTVIVQYGVDPETNRPVLMKIHKIKDAYRVLSPQEARQIVVDALARARESKAEVVDEQPVAGQPS